MVTEYHFENDFVVKYFIDELNYEQSPPSIFNGELMLIPSVVERFVYDNNEQQCKDIIRIEFDGNKKEFFKSLAVELSNHIYGSFNTAIHLNPRKHSGFRFLGKYQLSLYIPFNSAEDDKNIYTIVQQPSFKIEKANGHMSVIPDVGIFVNGFLVSYLQLKLPHRKQTAIDHGRGQIIGDYLEVIKRCVVDQVTTNKLIQQDPKQKDLLVQKTLKYFHSPMHMVAMDTSSAYIIRGISKHYQDVEKLYLANKANDAELKKDIIKSFFIDSVYLKEPGLSMPEQCKAVLFNLYDKNRIQNEILYFNFLSYERISNYKFGKKESTYKTRTPSLSYPRPNQKYGVEKVISEVVKKYKNEDNSEYELERLEKRLTDLNVSDAVKKRALEKRKAYKNNRNQFSLLLQYAAGFGKTYILCWLALMLKDLNDVKNKNSNDFLFDKILIISDRVDLRDQVDLSMQNMNIEKSLFAEADNRDALKKYLSSSSPRIIIVNIQKFPFLKDMLGEDELGLLKNKRIAFLIDEIHRSNSGAQHNSMTSIFDEVVDSLDGDSSKKNLIVGLTATPTDENLARFGDYQGCLEDIKWIPFDSYTMKEAVEDGFVLDPIKSLIPCAVELQYDEDEDKKLPSLKDIYENDERLKVIAKKIAEILVTTTFKKIYGYGKGMLACYSISAAKKYYDYINEELDLLTSMPKYSNFKGSKVYMVYTNNQEDNPAYIVCGHSSEKEVISAFKSDKNSLMIVVDKLQTGFDEPKLHTLFLDKEVRGISAVQTVCRVNRTCRNKEDSLVVDFSADNVNISNIKNAFDKYSGVVVSEFDSYSIKTQSEELYKKIIATDCYTKFFNDYKKNRSDINNAINLQEYVKTMFDTDNGKKLIIKDCEDYLNYLQKLGLIDNVIGIDAKYKEENLILFLRDLVNLIKGELKDNSSSKIKEVVDFWVENLGIIESDLIVIDEMANKGKSSAKLKESKDEDHTYSVIASIKQKNSEEKQKEIFIDDYIKKLHFLFDKIIELDKSKNDGRLMLKLNNSSKYNDSEINDEFQKSLSITIRRLKNDDSINKFIKEVSEHSILLKDDFLTFISNKV